MRFYSIRAWFFRLFIEPFLTSFVEGMVREETTKAVAAWAPRIIAMVNTSSESCRCEPVAVDDVIGLEDHLVEMLDQAKNLLTEDIDAIGENLKAYHSELEEYRSSLGLGDVVAKELRNLINEGFRPLDEVIRDVVGSDAEEIVNQVVNDMELVGEDQLMTQDDVADIARDALGDAFSFMLDEHLQDALAGLDNPVVVHASDVEEMIAEALEEKVAPIAEAVALIDEGVHDGVLSMLDKALQGWEFDPRDFSGVVEESLGAKAFAKLFVEAIQRDQDHTIYNHLVRVGFLAEEEDSTDNFVQSKVDDAVETAFDEWNFDSSDYIEVVMEALRHVLGGASLKVDLDN